jgi:cobalamin biosynthesis Mg chelatase CobN
MPDPTHPVDNTRDSTRDRVASGEEAESLVASPADVESAGRSCMVILALLAVIVALLLLWILVTSAGASN